MCLKVYKASLSLVYVQKGEVTVPEEIEWRVADKGRCGSELRITNGVD